MFVSAFEHYAFSAFDVEAVDYLLKPFDRSRFQQALAGFVSGLPARAARSCGEKSPTPCAAP